MSRRRLRRKQAKAQRHAAPPMRPAAGAPERAPTRLVVQAASDVERLAYTPSQAPGVGRSTLYRLLPHMETIELPWGTRLILVDELERLLTERRRPARARPGLTKRGRPPTLPAEIVDRIRTERDAGKSLRQIAEALNAGGTPTAHGGGRWWPSTVRSVLARSTPPN